ncbi:hypothetical protein OO014_15645 [Intrasporangium calvum]|uniref:Uncharacterized protein n=1 Tax=Intrasporangium calvum TaxID=53358 RepID=A0ABT5GKD9_9MICO|nr:hypothetical protein [Intrasporangium calvum]MDC5698689.1 hypothetical protein [Intrasporangium calvum]
MSAASPRSGRGPDAPTWRTLRFGRGPRWSLPQVALALAGAASAGAFLLSLQAAAGGLDPIWWSLVLVPLVTLTYAGSGVPLAFWGLLLVGWFLHTPAGSFSPWSVPAALALVAGHAAAALSATTPPAGGFPGPVLRTWARRTVLAALAAPAVALLAGALRGGGLEAGPAAYVIGLGGLALGVFLLRTESPVQAE